MFDFAKRKICANQLTNIMKGIAALAPTLLLTLILTSCMSDGYTDTAAGKSDTYINLNVSTPTAQARANAPANSPNFTYERRADTSGMRLLTNSASPKRRRRRMRSLSETNLTTKSSATTGSSQKY